MAPLALVTVWLIVAFFSAAALTLTSLTVAGDRLSKPDANLQERLKPALWLFPAFLLAGLLLAPGLSSL